MNSDRIKEIQSKTPYPDSVSVKEALMKVWNECVQESETKNYQIKINGKLVAEVDVKDDVWKVIGRYPFGSLYEVGSKTGKPVGDFISI